MEYLIYDQQDSANSSTDAEEETPLTAGEIEVVAKEIIRLHNEEGADFKDITLLVQKRTHNDLIMSILKNMGFQLWQMAEQPPICNL